MACLYTLKKNHLLPFITPPTALYLYCWPCSTVLLDSAFTSHVLHCPLFFLPHLLRILISFYTYITHTRYLSLWVWHILLNKISSPIHFSVNVIIFFFLYRLIYVYMLNMYICYTWIYVYTLHIVFICFLLGGI